MIEKIVHTAKHTVKASVLMPRAIVRSPLLVSTISCVAISRTPIDGGKFADGRSNAVDVNQAKRGGRGFFANWLS